MSYRGRGGRGYHPGNGPFRDLPPWERPGWIYGTGDKTSASTDPYSCARFPWLPRRWWVYSDVATGGSVVPSAEQTKQIIEKRIAAAEEHIAALRKRLGEIESGEKTK